MADLSCSSLFGSLNDQGIGVNDSILLRNCKPKDGRSYLRSQNFTLSAPLSPSIARASGGVAAS